MSRCGKKPKKAGHNESAGLLAISETPPSHPKYLRLRQVTLKSCWFSTLGFHSGSCDFGHWQYLFYLNRNGRTSIDAGGLGKAGLPPKLKVQPTSHAATALMCFIYYGLSDCQRPSKGTKEISKKTFEDFYLFIRIKECRHAYKNQESQNEWIWYLSNGFTTSNTWRIES